MLKTMTIKGKLRLLTVIVALSLIIVMIIGQTAVHTITKMEHAELAIKDLSSTMLSLRKDEKDFLARKDLAYLDSYQKKQSQLSSSISALEAELTNLDIDDSNLVKFKSIVEQYKQKFSKLVELDQKIGLTPENGLYGALRNAVHDVEHKLNAENNHTLLKDMLMLRRNEKDFMLRRDLKYVKEFDANYHIFQQDLTNSYVDVQKIDAINNAMATYKKDFHALVDAETIKGLTHNDGVQAQMRAIVNKTDTLLSQMETAQTEAIQQQTRHITFIAVVVSVLLIVLVAVFIFFLSKTIIDSIRQLAQIMREAQESNDLSIRASVESQDEIGDMAQAFNEMSQQFQSLLNEVASAVSSVSAAAEELSVITDQTGKGVTKQQSDTEQVATAMNEMTATVQEVARYSEEAAEASRSSDEQTQYGKQVVVRATDGIKALAGNVESSALAIEQLRQESDNIGTVLTVIQDIAEQTNLLALNAAIEAARAGDSGRGFAVVADEVRTLAQRSQKSTEEIQTIIERLQAGAKKSVLSMEEGKQQANLTVSEAEAAGEALDAIADAVSAIRDMNTHIASAAEEQSAVAEEINQNVSNIAHVAEENAEASRQTTDTSVSLASLASQLQQLMARFKI